MKELDEMEKANAKLSTAVEDVNHEKSKKNEVLNKMTTHFFLCKSLLFLFEAPIIH